MHRMAFGDFVNFDLYSNICRGSVLKEADKSLYVKELIKRKA